jgi:hypothetical protein
MNIATFSPKIFSKAEKSAESHWKVALYAASFVYALLLIRFGRYFSDALIIPSSIIVISVFLYGGFTRLRRIGDGTRIKAYIKGHEAWALILLAIFLIAGTVFYVAFESRLDARTGSHRIVRS